MSRPSQCLLSPRFYGRDKPDGLISKPWALIPACPSAHIHFSLMSLFTRKAKNQCHPRVETDDKGRQFRGMTGLQFCLVNLCEEFLTTIYGRPRLSTTPKYGHGTGCRRGTESRCVGGDSPGRCQQAATVAVPQDRAFYRHRRTCSGQPTELCPQHPQSVIACPSHCSLKLAEWEDSHRGNSIRSEPEAGSSPHLPLDSEVHY